MEFIGKTAPWLTQDPKSMTRFRNYVVDAMETIDFTLGNQKRGIQGSVNKLDFDVMKEQVSGMVTQLGAQGATLSSLEKRLGEAEKVDQEQGAQISQMETRLSGQISGVETALDVRISALEARIAVLEQGGQAPTTPTQEV